MTRRYITSMVAAIAVGVGAAVAYSGPAQAHMGFTRTGYHYGWHYGWHKGWHRYARSDYIAPAFYGGSCYQKQWAWTASGWRWEWVNTCNAGFGGTGLFGIGLLGF